ncbi:alpha/beta fold hydrolase [Aquabacterium sp. J223]|uniref:alpha/beta hydrolase family protein n=1 Tax=Aquabacterium sp. J223 TaxID=2898431 RepID=UPI0021ADD75C|nr:alpha/beta fold hydrolase [Aquabacterium sp. J223]UUX96735.1 alpha/beta fold hydrolase [Aquabacterium sp. J223]
MGKGRAMTGQALALTAADGFVLQGRLHGDPAGARAGVLLAPAMGVPQRFYADFAAWLAAQGFAVLTFDYRGIGASRPEAFRHSLRGLRADVDTWAEQDAAAALDALAARLPAGRPLHWIGHSLGGQIVGLVPRHERVDRIVTIAVGTGYWRLNAARVRWLVGWMWFVVVPLALRCCGYFPGRRLRKIGDLPAGVMAQWRRWCLQPDYLMSEDTAHRSARYARIARPLLSLSFTDDEYMSARGTERLHAIYAGAAREMRRIAPADIGERRIGHFGFFRPRFAATLWPQVAGWLAAGASDHPQETLS